MPGRPTVEVDVNDSVWKKLYQRMVMASRQNAHVRVGVLSDETTSEGLSLAGLAAIHEFGTPAREATSDSPGHPGIPERSFIRSTFYVEKANELHATLYGIAHAVVFKGVELSRGLGLLGQWAAAAVKNTITQQDIPPPLSDRTIEGKGSTKPLVDTGQLLNAITYEVEG